MRGRKGPSGPGPRPYNNPNTIYGIDGRPHLRSEETPADGGHYMIDRNAQPYAPIAFFKDGRPVRIERHACYQVTAESTIAVFARLGWDVALGPWHVTFGPDPCWQEAAVYAREIKPSE